MFTSKSLLLALAACGFATAQTSLCASPTITISSQADAAQLASCTSVNAVLIAPSVTGDIAIAGVETMTSLTSNNATQLTSITANSLTAISGLFSLQGLTTLGSLNMPMLSKVGTLNWFYLPALSSLGSFTTGIGQAGSLSIIQTGLQSLSGINLSLTTAFTVSQNDNLRSLTSNLAYVGGGVVVANNGPSFQLAFPNLKTAMNLTVRAVSSLNIPVLQTVNGTLGVYTSDLTSFSAPNLTQVTGVIALQMDASLTSVSAPKLTTVTGLTITDNPSLLNISGFPVLTNIMGAVNVVGNYSTFDLPDLAMVAGTFNAQSSGNFSCAYYQNLYKNKYIAGQYQCTPTSANPQTSPGSGDPSGTGTAATATKTGAAGAIKPVDILPMVAMTALVGTLVMAGGALRLAL